MGYRMYLGRSLKGEDLTKTFAEDGEPSYECYNSDKIEKLYELGKYVSWRPEGCKNLLPDDSDSEVYLVNKDFLLHLIEEYRKMVVEYHGGLFKTVSSLSDKLDNEQELTSDDKASLHDAVNYFRKKGDTTDFGCEWGDLTTADGTNINCLATEDKFPHEVTRSWSYEYGVFNLVHILKSFDWDKYDLIYYGI